MFRYVARKLAVALILILVSGAAGHASASGTDQTSTPAATSTASSTSQPNGITGTDPEPIDPDFVSTLLELLGLG